MTVQRRGTRGSNAKLGSLPPESAGSSSATNGGGSSHAQVNPDSLATASLEDLQTDDHRSFLNVVDDLRREGLDGILKLPQLVVFGDQSSGKSSVLEAITEIPFPRNENLCTRFATEIILRHHRCSSISTRITPDKNRPEHEQDTLRGFTNTITDFTQLSNAIAKATRAMGLKEIGQIQKAFAKDVLTIEICGPTRPQLTLVDLPGLIHSTNKMQSKDDVQLIKDLVTEYMENPRTIILAVISAKNDFANQIVLDYSKRIDKKGNRTLGIITKPDTLIEGTANQRSWLDLAQNKDIFFQLGWHMVRNRNELETHDTFAQRNAAELLFFSRGSYSELPSECKGIKSLRTRLSILLYSHLKKELPKLHDELLRKQVRNSDDLKELGPKRSTALEQRLFLTEIASRINDMLKAAINGQYAHPFFGDVNMKAAVDSKENLRRFRAVIQHLNIEFAKDIHLFGHKYEIPNNDSTSERIESEPPKKKRKTGGDHQPIKKTHNQAIDWVQDTIERSRGLELPGNFNPHIISHLFWEQSAGWGSLALEHIECVSTLCKDFVNMVLSEASPVEIKPKLYSFCVEVLEGCLRLAKEELEKIIADMKCSPSTYNQSYVARVIEQRRRKLTDMVSSVIPTRGAMFNKSSPEGKDYIERDALMTTMRDGIDQNMERFSAEDALDSQVAYYADELEYFIKCVTKQVVERHLIQPLTYKVLTPMVIAGLTERQVELLAAEPGTVTRTRERLEERKNKLDRGMKVFKEAFGGTV